MLYFEELTDGEDFTVDVKSQVLHLACCDCGLVHRIGFAIHGDIVGVVMVKDSRATGQLRRHKVGDLHNPGPKSKFKLVRRRTA